MFAAFILVLSMAALGQFVVFYYRAILVSVAAYPLTGYVQQVQGFPDRPLRSDDFAVLLQLQEICPQVGPDARSLRIARVYFQLLTAAKRAINGFVPMMHTWMDREQTLCTQFAAVLLDQRLARTAAEAAQVRSY
ncbi:MAG TPA: hypothetical protein VL099_01415 [Candidatus Binatia bacterium]|nr:hypothetical protein [Candidatus Binatia bacterium]